LNQNKKDWVLERDQLFSSFKKEVRDAKILLEFAVAEGYATQEGKIVNDSLIEAIKNAENTILKEELPEPSERASFEKAYRDLTQLLSPVTVGTLKATSAEYGRKKFPFSHFKQQSEATIWSRKLTLWTLIFVSLAIAHDYINVIQGQFLPPSDESSGGFQTILYYSNILLGIFVPFLYGGIGACVYLLRNCHQYSYKRQFDLSRIPEYYNRILLGLVSGGAITLFISSLKTDEGELIQLSAAALGFLAGYNTDLLFSTIERIVQAILPKVGIETMKRKPAQPSVTFSLEDISLKDLLDYYNKASSDKDRDLYHSLIERLRDRL
jgi:hypothetical protein